MRRVKVTMEAEPIELYIDVPDDTDMDLDGILYAIDCDAVTCESFTYALENVVMGGLDYGYTVSDVKEMKSS